MAQPLAPPANRREELHDKLVEYFGTNNVYFQPPESAKMQYPAIVYGRDFSDTQHANNSPYRHAWRYELTVIDRSPDSPLVDLARRLPMCAFARHFEADKLNHDVFSLFY